VSMGQLDEAFETDTGQWLFTSLHSGDQARQKSIISKQGNFHLIKVDKTSLNKASF